jgi:hypothetical protein
LQLTSSEIGIVVPTLGVRIDYLRSALLSVRRAGNARIHIVTPNVAELSKILSEDLYDHIILDHGKGLSKAIELGIHDFSDEIKFVSWLGDDDLLAPGSLSYASEPMQNNEKVVMVYGKCVYIDQLGIKIATNRSGCYAKFLMRVGPQLVSQPGSLIRRNAYLSVGGLSHSYKCAFDLDLFIKLQKFGKLYYTPKVLASFRWHADSLTVASRSVSVKEAREIRTSALPFCIRIFAAIWEYPISIAIRTAGKLLTYYSRVRRSAE